MTSTCTKAKAQEDDEASTSKFESELEITVETLGKMIIGCKRYKTDEQTAEVDDEIKPCSSKETTSQLMKEEKRRCSWSFRSGRYSPYLLPTKQKTRSRSLSEIDYKTLSKVRWKGDKDLDYLKLNILDEKKPIPCGVEAARPPTPDVEIDELSEYFSHFVRVEMKMSALAESMYC